MWFTFMPIYGAILSGFGRVYASEDRGLRNGTCNRPLFSARLRFRLNFACQDQLGQFGKGNQ